MSMKRTLFAVLTATILGGAAFGLAGCYATSAGFGVEASAPPEPVSAYYDSRAGYVWIDGHWVWTEAGWQWYPGYWEAERPGYVYVQGYWDSWGGHYYWRPGTWSRYRNGYAWVDGRWAPYQRGYHHYNYRTHSWVNVRDHRTRAYRPGGPAYRGGHGYREPVRDHRTGAYHGSGRTFVAPRRSGGGHAPVRDHRHHR